jgi:hypothetical protein
MLAPIIPDALDTIILLPDSIDTIILLLQDSIDTIILLLPDALDTIIHLLPDALDTIILLPDVKYMIGEFENYGYDEATISPTTYYWYSEKEAI